MPYSPTLAEMKGNNVENKYKPVLRTATQLTATERDTIRRYFQSKNATMSKTEVAALYGVTRESIVYIVYGKSR